jgi:hypothetical protein
MAGGWVGIIYQICLTHPPAIPRFQPSIFHSQLFQMNIDYLIPYFIPLGLAVVALR